MQIITYQKNKGNKKAP